MRRELIGLSSKFEHCSVPHSFSYAKYSLFFVPRLELLAFALLCL